jgi:MYXO-CTERM domain-containing protein
MRQSLLVLTGLLIDLAAHCVVPRASHACQCTDQLPTVESAAAEAEVIFVANQQEQSGTLGTPLRVTRIYKGTVPELVTLDFADCSIVRGRPASGDVLIYGTVASGSAVVPRPCSRSTMLSEAREDLAVLDRKFTPTAPATAPQPEGPTSHDEEATPTQKLPTVERRAKSGCGCSFADPEPLGAFIAMGLAVLVLGRRASLASRERKG